MDPRRQPSPRRSRQRFDDPLDRRLDQWLETGRQLVDGVAGTRPGSRMSAGRGGRSSGARLDAVGRWVGDKIDWLLDEEEADWGNSWGDARASREVRSREVSPTGGDWQDRRASSQPVRRAEKRPLEAISRRQPPLISAAQESPVQEGVAAPMASPVVSQGDAPGLDELDAWPDDESFRLERWQRSPGGATSQRTENPAPSTRSAAASPAPARRPLPRSSRRRA